MSALDWIRSGALWPMRRPRAAAQPARRLDFAFAQHQGDRAEQQDRVGAWRAGDGELLLVVVADGLGGLRGGAAAAARTVAAFRQAWRMPPEGREEAPRWLDMACRAAHRDIVLLQEETGAPSGSTVAAACLSPAWAVWCHVGDTRIYLMRGARLARRTRDHSLAEMLERAGDCAVTAADRNQLTQCLGGSRPPTPVIDRASLAAGDGLILASDGVWAQAPEKRLTRAFRARDLDAAATSLVGRAVDAAAGGSDNATILLVRAALAAS